MDEDCVGLEKECVVLKEGCVVLEIGCVVLEEGCILLKYFCSCSVDAGSVLGFLSSLRLCSFLLFLYSFKLSGSGTLTG